MEHSKTKRRIGIPKQPALSNLYAPFRYFFKFEASSSLLLLLSVSIALIWANSPWASIYFDLWATPITLSIGDYTISKPAILWINDGLMTLFFFIVGLEIKRAVLVGELANLKDAAFPIIAALGGMLIPILLFLAINWGTEGTIGWVIPMATDIAVALGVLALFGEQISIQLKMFLTTFAIADDIGAIIIMALFFSHGISIVLLGVALIVLIVLFALNWLGVQHHLAYAIMGLVFWLAFLFSGVHATIAGVLLAMTIPAQARVNTEDFCTKGRTLFDEFERAAKPGECVLTNKAQHAAVLALEGICGDVQPPLQRMERSLHPWVSFLIVPLFALANSGFSLIIGPLTPAGFTTILGIVVGLFLGKQIGITFFAWLGVKSGIAEKPEELSWRQIHAVSCLGGVGFTMALFFANLAFITTPILFTWAKMGILLGSLISGITGFLLLGGTRIFSALWQRITKLKKEISAPKKDISDRA